MNLEFTRLHPERAKYNGFVDSAQNESQFKVYLLTKQN